MLERNNGQILRLEIPPDLRPKEDQMREFRAKHGLRAALFDFDDTLIVTNPIFNRQFEKWAEECSTKVTSHTYQEILEKFHVLQDKYHPIYKVNPNIFKAISREFEEDFGIELSDGHRHFDEIYKTAPELKTGAIEALQTFTEAGFVLGLVTHAGEEWTNFKLDALNLRPWFKSITIVPVDETKSSKHWTKAINSLFVNPQEVIAIGDSVIGDIQAAGEAGAGFLVHVPPTFSIHKNGELPKRAHTALGIENVIDVLINLEKIENTNA